MQLSKHFKLEEFEKSSTAIRLNIKNKAGSGEIKNLTDLCYGILEPVRAKFEKPIMITSGYRTEAHNTLVGGRVGSSHKKGLAVDIGYYGSRERYLILNALMHVGVTRFGIGKTFIHCDVDKSKDPDVIWLY